MVGKGTSLGSTHGSVFADSMREVRRARRRWLWRSVRTAVLAVFATSACGIALLRLLSETGRRSAAADGAWLALAASIAVGAVGVSLTVWRRLPEEALWTRKADDEFGLESRLVTARELAVAPRSFGASDALRQALFRDLAANGRAVRAEELVPARLRARDVLALGILAVATVAAVNAETIVGGLSPAFIVSNADGGSELAAVTATELGAELDALAEALDEEAARTSDAYVGALAENARRLAADIRASNDRFGARNATNGVAQVLEHVESALGSRFAASGVPGGIEPREDLLGGTPSGPDAKLPLGRLRLPGRNASGSGHAAAVRSVRERLELSQSQQVLHPSLVSAGSSATEEGRQVREAGLVGAQAEDAGGTPTGAAQRSTDAPGDAAGAGSQPLDVGGTRTGASFERAGDIRLPSTDAAGGRRIGVAGELARDRQSDAAVVGRSAEAVDAGSDSSTAGVAYRDSVRRDAGGWRRASLDPNARLLAQRLFGLERPEVRSDAQ